VTQPRHAFACARGGGETGVTADRDKIEFKLFNPSSIFNIVLSVWTTCCYTLCCSVLQDVLQCVVVNVVTVLCNTFANLYCLESLDSQNQSTVRDGTE